MDIRYGVHHGVGEEQCSRLYEKRTHMWNNAVNSFRKGLTCAHQQMLSMTMKVQYHSTGASRREISHMTYNHPYRTAVAIYSRK